MSITIKGGRPVISYNLRDVLSEARQAHNDAAVARLTKEDLSILEAHKDALVDCLSFAISKKRGYKGREAYDLMVYQDTLPLSCKDDFVKTSDSTDSLWNSKPTSERAIEIYNRLLQSCADHLDTISTESLVGRLNGAKAKAQTPELKDVDNATILGTELFREVFISSSGEETAAKNLLDRLSSAEQSHPEPQAHGVDVLGLVTMHTLLLYGAGLGAYIDKHTALLNN